MINKNSQIDIRNLKAQIHKICPGSELDIMISKEPDSISASDFIALAPRWAKMSEIKEITLMH